MRTFVQTARGAVLAAALFTSSAVHADHWVDICTPDVPVGYQGTWASQVYTGSSPGDVCSQIEAAYKAGDSSPSDNTCSLTVSQHNCTCKEGNFQQGNPQISVICGEGPGACDGTAGNEVDAQWSTGGLSNSICGNNSSEVACIWTFSGVGVMTGEDFEAGRSYYGTWTQTDGECEGGAEAAHGENGGGYNCIESGDDTTCFAESGTNCGTFNGQPVCVESVPPGNCMILGDGGYACDDAAGTPPTPDIGVPGIEADPDGQIVSEGGGGDTINYYNNTTVGGSTTVEGPPGDYEPPPDGDDCTPGVDCPGEWVDRDYDPGVPGQFEAFVTPTADQLEPLMPAPEYIEDGSVTWFEQFKTQFPFSLIANPIASFTVDAPQAPVIEYHPVHGPAQALDFSVLDPVATAVRALTGFGMVWGFWWLMVETVRGFMGGLG